MKYFTLEWWENRIDPENQMAVNDRYCGYIASVESTLLPDLRRLHREVSLHDARLRRFHFSDGNLELQLDGERTDRGRILPGRRHFKLTYQRVSSITITETPEAGVPTPDGWGDLGYNEIEIVHPGLFEHRILFSSSVELHVRFSDFALHYDDELP